MTLREIQEEMECFGCEGVSFKGFLCPSCWRMSSKFPKRIRRQARKGNVYYQKRLKTLLVVAQSRAFLSQKQAKIRQCVELLQDMQADLWLTGRISARELKDLVRPEMLRWFARQYTGDHVGSSAAAEVEIEWARQNWPLDFSQSGYTAFAGEIRIGTCKRVSDWWAVWIKNGDGVRTFRDEGIGSNGESRDRGRRCSNTRSRLRRRRPQISAII